MPQESPDPRWYKALEAVLLILLSLFMALACAVLIIGMFGLLCKDKNAHLAESVLAGLNNSNFSAPSFIRANRIIFVEDQAEYENQTYGPNKSRTKQKKKALGKWSNQPNNKNQSRARKYIPEEAHMKEYVAPYNDFEFATCDCFEDDEVVPPKVITRCVRTMPVKCQKTTTRCPVTTTVVCITTTFICTTSTCRCVSPDPCKSTSRKCKKKYCTITTECPPKPTKYDCVPEGPWSFPTQSYVVTAICEKCVSTTGGGRKNFPPWWSCKTKCTKTTPCDEYETTTCECETTTTCTTSTCRFITICTKETTTGCPTTTCLTWTTTCPTTSTTTTCTTATCPPITSTATTCPTSTCKTTTCPTTTCRTCKAKNSKRLGLKRKLKFFPDKDLDVIDIDDD